MSHDVAAAYDAMADRYVAHVRREFDKRTMVRERLEAFASMVEGQQLVADVGCGPGHVTKLLSDHGLNIVGYDIAEGLLVEARRSFPDLSFRVGDLTAIDLPDASLGGLVSRHSTIHLAPGELAAAFSEWARVLVPGAPLFVSFFAAATRADHGTPFDHAVVTAYALSPDVIAEELEASGFGDLDVGLRPFGPTERPLDQAIILARLSA